MNNKGQALVEFVLILPIFIFLLFAIIDFGRIYNSKNTLSSDSMDIINLFKNGKTVEAINNIYSDYSTSINLEDEYYQVLIQDEVNIITPGLGSILGNPYKIEVKRYLPYA